MTLKPTPLVCAVNCIETVALVMLAACANPFVHVPPPKHVEVNSSDLELIDYIATHHKKASVNPASGIDRGVLGMIYDANGFSEAALRTYSEASQLDREEMRWPYLLALAKGKTGHLEQALENIDIAIERDADYIPSYLAKAFWLIDLARFDEAQEVLEDVQTRTSDQSESSTIHVALAQIHLERGQIEETHRILKALPMETLSHPYVSLLMERTNRESGETAIPLMRGDRSETNSFTQISWSDPIAGEVVEYTRGLTAETLLAQKLIDGGRVEDALSLAESLLERYPGDPRPVQLQNAALVKLDRTIEARAVLEEAVGQHPEDHLLRYNLGKLAEHDGDIDFALAQYEHARGLKSGFLPSYDAESLLLIHQKRYDQAIKVLQEAIVYSPSSSEMLHRLGIAYGSMGDWQKSADYLELALEHDRGNAIIWAHLALSLSELQQYEKAYTAIQHAIEIDASEPKVANVISMLIDYGVLTLPPKADG